MTPESPFSPRFMAEAMVKAKFGGLVPDTLTATECIELMMLFAKYESERADTAINLLTRQNNILATPSPDVG